MYMARLVFQGLPSSRPNSRSPFGLKLGMKKAVNTAFFCGPLDSFHEQLVLIDVPS